MYDFGIDVTMIEDQSRLDAYHDALKVLEGFETAIMNEACIISATVKGQIDFLARLRFSRQLDIEFRPSGKNDVILKNGTIPLVRLRNGIGVNSEYLKEPVAKWVAILTVRWIDNKINELVISKQNPSETKPIPAKTFKDIFIVPDRFEQCIDALRQVEPPIIGDDGQFILGRNSKSAIVAFADVLIRRGLISPLPDDQLATLLCDQFSMTIDERTLRANKSKCYLMYFRDLQVLIQK
jgi:hypothetical protein